MSFALPPWENNLQPSQGNVRGWLDNLYGKFQPVEQARWNQSNIDSLFYAGEQRFINSYFNFYPQFNWQNFNFNVLAQTINMVTGYQRQHRRSVTYLPAEGHESTTTDQYTKLIIHANNMKNRLEKFSQACEQATISGMVLIQPYLDYTDDPVEGTLDLKLWSYNSFLIDPYFREPDASDANFIWVQQYISKEEALIRFPDQRESVRPMAGTPQRYGNFYFLPENYNMARNDLLVLSTVWYKSRKKRKKLYNRQTGQLFDFAGSDVEMLDALNALHMMEEVEVEVPTWKMASILNDQLMWQGFNPLGFDACPMVPVFWNYDPHLSYYDLRVRSLTRICRDPQYLLNRRIILNHDISESSINSGWLRKENAVANEENLRYAGQGKDIIIKDGYEMSDVQKIIPNAVPPSDMALADQLMDLVFRTTGVSLENFGLGENADKSQSGLAIMLKQGAGLMVLQKYFDQWDVALKILGNLDIQIIQNKWSATKVAMMIGEEPAPNFFSKIFSKYHVLVEEGLNTPTQKQMAFAQIIELNQMLGGIIPAREILEMATFQNKDKIIKAVDEQMQQTAAIQNERHVLEQTEIQTRLQVLQAKAASEIAMARERHGRAESNIGLFEERLSEITHNRAMATKAKVESLEKLLDLVAKYGELEASIKAAELQSLNIQQEQEEDVEKADARRTALANDFFNSIMKPNQQPIPMQLQEGGIQEALL